MFLFNRPQRKFVDVGRGIENNQEALPTQVPAHFQDRAFEKHYELTTPPTAIATTGAALKETPISGYRRLALQNRGGAGTLSGGGLRSGAKRVVVKEKSQPEPTNVHSDAHGTPYRNMQQQMHSQLQAATQAPDVTPSSQSRATGRATRPSSRGKASFMRPTEASK